MAAGDVVTNVCLQITVGGTATSLSKVGLYRKDGTRLGLSADQGSAWNTAGTYVVPLTATVTVPLTDLYYLAVIAKTGTTMPTMLGGPAFPQLALGSAPAGSGSQTGQTDLIASATIGTANSVNPWLGCS